MGLRTVEERQLLPGFDIIYDMKDGRCNNREGMKAAIQLWSEMPDLDAIIGDSCSVVCQPVGLLAAAWNIPEVSNACTSDALSNVAMFPTFTRSVGVYKQFVQVIGKVAETFRWSTVAIITETADLFRLLAEYGKTHLESRKMTVYYNTFKSTVNVNVLIPENLLKLKRIMQKLKSQVRIFVLLMYPTDLRHFRILAHQEDMLTSEFGFYGVDMFPAYDKNPVLRPDLPDEFLWQGHITMDVEVHLPDNWETFKEECLAVHDLPIFHNFETPTKTSEITYRAGKFD